MSAHYKDTAKRKAWMREYMLRYRANRHAKTPVLASNAEAKPRIRHDMCWCENYDAARLLGKCMRTWKASK